LKTFEKTGIFNFKITISIQQTFFDFSPSVDKCNYTTATGKHQFTLILEENLDNLVWTTKQNSFPGSLPLFDVARNLDVKRSRRGILFGEGECQGAELAIAFKIALEMLKQNNFLFNTGRVIIKVVILHILSRLISFAILDTLNVTKVEQVVCDRHNFGAVVIKDTIWTIGQFVAKAVLRAEVNKFAD